MACCVIPPALPAQTAFSQRAAPVLRERKIAFSNAKPVFGLGAEAAHVSGICSSDGLTYFDSSAGQDSPRDLYTVSTTAEVKHLLRKLPTGFTEITVRSLFASEHTIVTLLEANNPDDRKYRMPEPQYLLSVSDHDGDQSDLLELNFHFKPLRAGIFGSGDFLVLGWDTANQLPVLATLKPDGTVRRFMDMGEMQRSNAKGAANAELLAGAALVPFGTNILLTYPGTTQPVWILRGVGQGSPLQLDIPAGFVLHDVLGSDGWSSVIARVEALPAPQPAAAIAGETRIKAPPPQQRLLEFSSTTGALMREFSLETVPMAAITCAAKQSLTAVYLDSVASVGTPVPDASGSASTPTQLVIANVRR